METGFLVQNSGLAIALEVQHLGTEDHASAVNRKKAVKQKTLIYWRNDEFGFRHSEFEVSTERTKGCIYQVARKADL